MALARYVVGSFVVAGGLVYHAMSTREQYFPAMLYLSSSKLSVVVLGNLAFALTLCLGHLLKAIFLGRLREAEVERLYERAKDAIMETCLAMTIFREEFNVKFVVLFVSLLFVKIFHWLCGDRVEHVETAPATSRLTHVRVCSLMFLLFALDVSFLRYAVAHTLKIGPSVLLLFGFEYVILASKAVATFARYCIVALDNFLDGRWEGKGTAVFYLELVTDLLHLFVYFVFFLIIFAYYGLPVHLVRDLYLTFRNFRRRVGEFLRYRKVTANLDERFPDCTREELQEGDDVCIICRDEMACGAAGGARPKKLPCGHCFHLGCLRSWLERQQACPTCRAAVVPAEDAHAANGENEAGGGGNPDAAEDAAMRAAFRRELFGEGGGGAAGEGGTPADAAAAADANANANPAAPPPRFRRRRRRRLTRRARAPFRRRRRLARRRPRTLRVGSSESPDRGSSLRDRRGGSRILRGGQARGGDGRGDAARGGARALGGGAGGGGPRGAPPVGLDPLRRRRRAPDARARLDARLRLGRRRREAVAPVPGRRRRRGRRRAASVVPRGGARVGVAVDLPRGDGGGRPSAADAGRSPRAGAPDRGGDRRGRRRRLRAGADGVLPDGAARFARAPGERARGVAALRRAAESWGGGGSDVRHRVRRGAGTGRRRRRARSGARGRREPTSRTYTPEEASRERRRRARRRISAATRRRRGSSRRATPRRRRGRECTSRHSRSRWRGCRCSSPRRGARRTRRTSR